MSSKISPNLAQKAYEWLSNLDSDDKTINDLLDYLKIPKKQRSDSFVASLFHQIKQIPQGAQNDT